MLYRGEKAVEKQRGREVNLRGSMTVKMMCCTYKKVTKIQPFPKVRISVILIPPFQIKDLQRMGC